MRVEKDVEHESQVIPLVIGTLGRTPIKFRNWLDEIDTESHNRKLPSYTRKVFEI